MEYRVQWPDASLHWLEGRGRVLIDESGKPWGVAGVCMDITARKKTEADLKFLAQASAELAALDDYQATLDKIAHLAVPRFADWCAVDMLADTSTVQRVAVAHVDPAKEELARDLYRRFPPDPERITGGDVWHILRTGHAERVEDISDEVLAAAVRDPDHLAALRSLGLRSYIGVPLAVRGRTLGVITFVTAESHRRYGARTSRWRRTWPGGPRSRSRTPPCCRPCGSRTAPRTCSSRRSRTSCATRWHRCGTDCIIKRVPGDARRVEQMADMIERQVGQLTRLVDDLLDVSRINTGKIELKKQHTNLVRILGSALETSRPHIEAAQHELSVRLPDEPTDLDADPVRLAQVFSNLLNNAAKYTRQGGSIDVVVEPARTLRGAGPRQRREGFRRRCWARSSRCSRR